MEWGGGRSVISSVFSILLYVLTVVCILCVLCLQFSVIYDWVQEKMGSTEGAGSEKEKLRESLLEGKKM